ncbi:MAG: hypothetical protein WCD35_02340 [Mycobacteriales bacterium]
MEDFDFDFDQIDFLPGVDLYLWLRIVVAALSVVVSGVVLVEALSR